MANEILEPTGSNWIDGFNGVAAHIEEWAKRKGWNSDDPIIVNMRLNSQLEDLVGPEVYKAMIVNYDIAKQGLMVTELAESIEGRRHGDPPSDKIPQFTAQEEELADLLVRVMHHAAHRKLRVAEALLAKLDYNENRPYKHGKLA